MDELNPKIKKQLDEIVKDVQSRFTAGLDQDVVNEFIKRFAKRLPVAIAVIFTEDIDEFMERLPAALIGLSAVVFAELVLQRVLGFKWQK